MIFRTLKKSEAAELFYTWSNLPDDEFEQRRISWGKNEVNQFDFEYALLRKDIVSEYRKFIIAGYSNYKLDVRFGARLFSILESHGFTPADAANDGVWIYLSMKVFPDLVYDRWKNLDNPRELNAARFYDKSMRIWLKIIWYYIYLSYQGSMEETLRILYYSQDISQITDRPGKYGFRVELIRRIMAKLHRITETTKDRPTRLLGRIMVLSGIKSSEIEPEMFDGGIDGYVDSLFGEFIK